MILLWRLSKDRLQPLEKVNKWRPKGSEGSTQLSLGQLCTLLQGLALSLSFSLCLNLSLPRSRSPESSVTLCIQAWVALVGIGERRCPCTEGGQRRSRRGMNRWTHGQAQCSGGVHRPDRAVRSSKSIFSSYNCDDLTVYRKGACSCWSQVAAVETNYCLVDLTLFHMHLIWLLIGITEEDSARLSCSLCVYHKERKKRL